MESFLITSPLLKVLRERLEQAKQLIQKALNDGRPIVLRHHNDCDGYCSALVMEQAILPLIERLHTKQYAWRYLKRSPSKTPYYSYADALKDINQGYQDVSMYNKPMPLIISMDNGSSHEDLLALKKAKVHGAQLLVIDHHYPGEICDGKCEVDSILDVHVNPFLVGYDGRMCTAMLCVELACMLNDDAKAFTQIAAIGGYADRCQGKEFEDYLAIAQKKGFDAEYLQKLSSAINWEVFHSAFFDARHLLALLIGPRTKEQEAMVELSFQEILRLREHYKIAIEKYAQVKEQGSVIIVEVDVEALTQRGEYFSAGKITSLTNDLYKEKFPDKKIITLGCGSQFITVRASKGIMDGQ